jgi:hypothetical protein
MSGLLRSLELESPPDIPGRDNLRTLALCEAVLASALEHRATSPEEFLAGRSE